MMQVYDRQRVQAGMNQVNMQRMPVTGNHLQAQQMKQRNPQMFLAQQGGRMQNRPINGKIVEV